MPNPIVVIDPGHGGRAKIGGSSPNNAQGYNGLLERDLTLDLAKRVLAAMSKRVTADVRLTRASDVNLSLADRAAVAKDANADIFLSIHFNGSPDSAVDGTEAWTATHANARSKRLAQRLSSGVAKVATVRDRGVKERDLGVLVPSRHAARTAACLLEVAFLSNRAEADKLTQPKYLDDIALAVAQGIGDTLTATDASSVQAVFFGTPTNQRLISPPMLADHLLKPDRKSRLPASTPTLAIRWNFDAAKAPAALDLAIHFHGFVSPGSEIDVASKADMSGIDLDQRKRLTVGLVPRGWKTGETAYLPRLDKDRKPVLGADDKPIMDAIADKVHFPALVDGGGKGLVDLIAFARTWVDGDLAKRAAGTTRLDRCIFTAHSGGGARLLRALGNGQDPNEVHLFDALYEKPAELAKWVARHIAADADLLKSPQDQWASLMHAKGGACRVVARGGTLENSRALQVAIDAALAPIAGAVRDFLRKFYRVEQTRNVEHNDIPVKFGAQLLADAGADLTPAVNPVPAVAPAKTKEWESTAQSAETDQYYACLAANMGIKSCPAIRPMCIPPRKAGALAGSAVLGKPGVVGDKEPRSGAAWKAREDGIVEEILAGNVPSFLRALKKVSTRLKDKSGVEHAVDLFVMPDYLAVGGDTDFVTVPMDGPSAQRVADAFGCILPTARMVWEIHDKAEVKLNVRPRPYAALANPKTRDSVPKEARAKFDAKDQASTWAYVEYDNEMRNAIHQKLDAAGLPRTSLVSGYRKDVIVTKGLAGDASKLCFFGGWLDWTNEKGEKRHILQGREGGNPQQGPHPAHYADYSHGVRLVSDRIVVDGKDHSATALLKDANLGWMLANEGPFDLGTARYR